MKRKLLLSSVIVSAFLLLACSDNNAENTHKDSSSVASTDSYSGDDMYYEMTTTSKGKDINISGLTKMYISSKGDMRSEMKMTSSFKGKVNSSLIVLIGHVDKPDESISIDDTAKTYTINHIDRNELGTTEKIESSVTKIGEEKILGFNCVHAKVISKKSIGGFYSTVDTLDIWRSNEVPMQSSAKDLMTRFESKTGGFMYSKDVADKLKQMGCEGFIVKMTMGSKRSSMVMQLTKAERKDLSASMFQIPSGYKEVKEGL